MSAREAAISELQAAPEPVVREALEFILFLKSRTGTAAGKVDAMGYPAGYFDSTAGSFANEPLERPGQPPLDHVPACRCAALLTATCGFTT
jgi:hypothetical protein